MNIRPTLEKLYPTGSYGGQCFVFLHRLADFPPVGNLLSSKIHALFTFGIPHPDTIKVGDILLLNYWPWGHGAMVNSIVGGKLCLTESNFYYNGRIYHNRQIDPTDPRILGVFRRPLLFKVPVRVIQIKLVQVAVPWASMADKFADIRAKVLEYSRGRLDVNINTDYIALNPPFVGQPEYPAQEGIEMDWYKVNILPHKGLADIVCLLVPHFMHPQPTYGWWTMDGQTQVFADENETLGAMETGVMNLFVHAFLHENFGHAIFAMTGQPDTTHQYLQYGNDQGQVPKWDFQGMFDSFNYDKI